MVRDILKRSDMLIILILRAREGMCLSVATLMVEGETVGNLAMKEQSAVLFAIRVNLRDCSASLSFL